TRQYEARVLDQEPGAATFSPPEAVLTLLADAQRIEGKPTGLSRLRFRAADPDLRRAASEVERARAELRDQVERSRAALQAAAQRTARTAGTSRSRDLALGRLNARRAEMDARFAAVDAQLARAAESIAGRADGFRGRIVHYLQQLAGREAGTKLARVREM